MNSSQKAKVLYLDDVQENLDTFKANFRREFEVHTVSDPIEAHRLISELEIEIVVTDHRMPNMTGVDFLEKVAAEFPHVQRLLISGYTEFISAVEAVNKGKVFRIISKPLSTGEVKEMIVDAWKNLKNALEKDETIAALERQNKQFEFMLRQKLLS